jgi:hypothetical protein
MGKYRSLHFVAWFRLMMIVALAATCSGVRHPAPAHFKGALCSR